MISRATREEKKRLKRNDVIVLNYFCITMSMCFDFLSMVSLVLTDEEVKLTFEKGKTAARKVELCDIVNSNYEMLYRYTSD